ncbi:Phosphopantetheine adenylyltransferase [Lachnospiraceae bacterium TWA4]|nr:Phosphopantetheine adenylyltransferase [Lachnospiraceae bacterium TWA4]
MRTGIYPGSFDPVTNGHLDIIKRASKLFDKLILGVLHNPYKNPIFEVEERIAILKEVTKDLDNIEVLTFEGLLVNFAKEQNCTTIVRGLRAITDFEEEIKMAQINRIIGGDIDTIFLTTSVEYSYLSSSTVKEVALFHGDVSPFVPPIVEQKIKEKYGYK